MATDLVRQTDQPRDVAVADPEAAAGALAHVLGTGDLRQLSNEQRVGHYLDVCRSLGINPRTRPFDWIEFYDPESGGKKLTLYPNQSCAAQLRRQHQISVRTVRREQIGEGDNAMFVVEVEGTTPNGRTGSATKYVALVGRAKGGGTYPLAGQQLANAYMKAETGALRRLTFSMVGMASPPDVDELARPRVVVVDGTGAVLEAPTAEQKALAEDPRLARSIGEPTYEDLEIGESDLPSQAVGPDELERLSRDGPRPTLHADVARWQGAFFSEVSGTSLDDDDARHDLIAGYTAERWPKAKQTGSLTTFLKRCTDSEAGDFLDYVRGLVSVEDAPNKPSGVTPEVHDAAVLTGAPPLDPPRPEDGKSYTRAQWEAMYAAWSPLLRRLDRGFDPVPDEGLKGLSNAALKGAVMELLGYVDNARAALAAYDEDAEEDEPAGVGGDAAEGTPF